MAAIGLRELRQDASGVIRRVEAGEEIDVTVSGRLVARIVPAERRRWRSFDEVSHIFEGPADPDWETDRNLIDQTLYPPR